MEVDPPENIQNHELQRRICELEQKRAEDQTVIKHLCEENVNLYSLLQGSNETRTEGQDTLQSAELTRVNQELIESNAQVVKLLGQVEESTQEMSELRTKATAYDKIVEKNDELQQKVNHLEEELVKIKQSVEYAASQDLREQLEASKQENVGLKGAQKKAESELAEMDQKIKTIIDLNSDWCTKLELAYQRNHDLENESATKTRRFNEILNYIDPSNTLRNQLGTDLAQQVASKFIDKQHEDALELLFKQLMVEQSGRNDAGRLGASWNIISRCWSELSSYEKALEAAEKAIRYNPTNASYFYKRGLAHKALDNKAEAIADFKKLLELNPNHPWAEFAKRELADLEAQHLP